MTLSHILWIYCDDDKSAPVSLLYNRILSLCWTFCTITKRKSVYGSRVKRYCLHLEKHFLLFFIFFRCSKKYTIYQLHTYQIDIIRQQRQKVLAKKAKNFFCKLNFSCKPCHFSSLICIWDDIGWIGLFKELHLQVQLIIT